MDFYTWSDQRCCLPKGATNATLENHHPNLLSGSVLIFEEVLGLHTANPEMRIRPIAMPSVSPMSRCRTSKAIL